MKKPRPLEFRVSSFGLVAGIDLAVALLCPFTVVSMALNRGRFARLLSGSIPYFLGAVSFSIYLIHEPCRVLAVRLFSLIHPGPSRPLLALVFALVGSLAVVDRKST